MIQKMIEIVKVALFEFAMWFIAQALAHRIDMLRVTLRVLEADIRAMQRQHAAVN